MHSTLLDGEAQGASFLISRLIRRTKDTQFLSKFPTGVDRLEVVIISHCSDGPALEPKRWKDFPPGHSDGRFQVIR